MKGKYFLGVPGSTGKTIEALDRAMRDLSNSNCPMGGCTILFPGDFLQILPVITRGTRREQMKLMHRTKIVSSAAYNEM